MHEQPGMLQPAHTPHRVASSSPLLRLSLPLAVLVLVASWGGVALPAMYARETPSWAAQAMGQDWVNLVVVVPLLVIGALGTRRGSLVAEAVLGGALLYSAYSYVLYAFAVRFNALFLVYCGALGLSSYALGFLLAHRFAQQSQQPHAARLPLRSAAIYQLLIAGAFGVLWLAQIVSALLRGADPPGVEVSQTPTNAVHVLDLALILPALALSGVSLLRRRVLGFVLTPVLLVFSVLMSLAIAAMELSMASRGLSDSLGMAGGFVALAAIASWIFVSWFRRLGVPMRS